MTDDELFEKIKHFNDTFVDEPDGAFFAMAEGEGITVDDWAWFAEECEKRGTYK